MKVQYKDYNFKCEERTNIQDISSLLFNEILYRERRGHSEEVPLQDQPQKVVEAMGRLVELLLNKGIMNLEDLKYVADCSWSKGDSLTLLPDDQQE